VQEQGQIERQRSAQTSAIAELVSHQFLGVEAFVPAYLDIQRHRKIGHVDWRIEFDVLFEAPGNAHCTGYRGPGGMPRVQQPGQPRVGLVFEAAEIVVLELHAERQEDFDSSAILSCAKPL